MRAYEPFVSTLTNDSYACLRLNSREAVCINNKDKN